MPPSSIRNTPSPNAWSAGSSGVGGVTGSTASGCGRCDCARTGPSPALSGRHHPERHSRDSDVVGHWPEVRRRPLCVERTGRYRHHHVPGSLATAFQRMSHELMHPPDGKRRNRALSGPVIRSWRRRWDLNPRSTCANNTLAGCPIRPLWHVSAEKTIGLTPRAGKTFLQG
jgi:hypothetical protein